MSVQISEGSSALDLLTSDENISRLDTLYFGQGYGIPCDITNQSKQGS